MQVCCVCLLCLCLVWNGLMLVASVVLRTQMHGQHTSTFGNFPETTRNFVNASWLHVPTSLICRQTPTRHARNTNKRLLISLQGLFTHLPSLRILSSPLCLLSSLSSSLTGLSIYFVQVCLSLDFGSNCCCCCC